MSRLRRDPLTGEPILIAPERRLRPNAFEQETGLPGGICPFCPGNERETPPEVARIGSEERWDVRVVPNRYPFAGVGDVPGVHEVVIESPAHEEKFENLSIAQMIRVLTAWRGRYAAHSRNRAVRHLVLFRNDGRRAGQSIEHLHAQIVGLPFVPDRVKRELAAMRAAARRGEACRLCGAAVEGETVAENAHFRAFAPTASRAPWQVRIAPRRHAGDLGHATDEEVAALAPLLLDAVSRMKATLGDVSWNLVVNGAPLRGEGSEAFHWWIDVIPRLASDGGFELATGIPINIVRPEDAAAELRAARPEKEKARR